MDFNKTIVEAGATLRDPHFAFGFFVTVAVLVAASFCAVFFWRHQSPRLQSISAVAALIGVLVALGTRNLISLLANLAVRATAGDNLVVHYWYTRPYVWSVWSLAAASLLAATVVRASRGRRHGRIDTT